MCLSKGFYGFLIAGVLSLTLMAGCGGGGGGGSSSTSDNNNTGDSTYSISGTVTDSSNVAISGVTVALTDASTGSTTTDSSGSFTFTGLANGSYTVTPSKTDYTFNPASSDVTVSGADITGQDFVGSVASGSTTYSISGKVADSSNVGISGLTVALTGASTSSTTTDSSGNYTFSGLANGSYTVTPSKTDYTFNPSSMALTVNGADITGQDFVGSATGGSGSIATGRMPDTNQTTSYTSTFGEDHDYTINPPSYTDNGDGTITDNVTGLVWQKQDDGTERTWADANAYCDTTTLGGYSDWRLPSQIELISIIDNGGYNPSIYTAFFPGTSSSGYWSSTTEASDASGAWGMFFHYGYSDFFSKTSLNYVRCVRGGETTQSLTDNGNGTVTDSGTLLTWQQGENSAMTWEAALSYCEGLTLAEQTDWRLPNHKELMSVIDYTRYNPSINTTFFPGTSSSYYWSSTTDASNTSSAWGVHFRYGGSDGSSNKTDSYYVRCVRGGQ